MREGKGEYDTHKRNASWMRDAREDGSSWKVKVKLLTRHDSPGLLSQVDYPATQPERYIRNKSCARVGEEGMATYVCNLAFWLSVAIELCQLLSCCTTS